MAPAVSASSFGAIRLRYSERILAVENTTGNSEVILAKRFNPGHSGCVRLDNFAKTFDRYRIHGIRVRYLPSVGAMVDGAVTFGVDWNWTIGNSSNWVNALYPKTRTPVWKSAQLNVPRNIMPSAWLNTNLTQAQEASTIVGSSFALGVIVPSSKKSFGEIWLDYDVTFQGSKETA